MTSAQTSIARLGVESDFFHSGAIILSASLVRVI